MYGDDFGMGYDYDESVYTRVRMSATGDYELLTVGPDNMITSERVDELSADPFELLEG